MRSAVSAEVPTSRLVDAHQRCVAGDGVGGLTHEYELAA
jgi:hypothetical protein